MRGVLLAGGNGSRLMPLTKVTNKHLLPVGSRPMIAWPLENLVNSGIENIIIVTGGEHFASIARLLGSGKNLGDLGIKKAVNLAYCVQDRAGGIAEALGLTRNFVGIDNVCVILGDNIYGDRNFLNEGVNNFRGGAHLFLKRLEEHEVYEENNGTIRAKYGMAEVKDGRILGIEEKPAKPKQNLAVTGAYIYDTGVYSIIDTLKPSQRGELEISDVNNAYIVKQKMSYDEIKGSWSDAGSHETLQKANSLASKRN